MTKEEATLNPASLSNEFAILCELGLNQDEINYIRFLKTKQQLRRRWED